MIWKTYLFVLLINSFIYAVDIQKINKKAVFYLNNNQPEKAYTLLYGSYKTGIFDNQMLFLLMITSNKIDDIDKALFYQEQLLRNFNTVYKKKLEAALLHCLGSQYKKAQELLLSIKSLKPPKKISDDIDLFLLAIGYKIPKYWNAKISMGYLYDSNVIAGPDRDTILTCNHSFAPLDEGVKNSDYALYYKFSLAHFYRFSSFSWQSMANIQVTDYKNLNDYDYQVLMLKTGPYWKNKQLKLSIPFVVKRVKEGHKNEYYTFSSAVAPSIEYQALPKLLTSFTVAFQKKHYHDFDAGDNNSLTFDFSTKYFIGSGSYAKFSGYKGNISDGIETDNKSYKGLKIGYYKKFSKNLNLYIDSSIHYSDYDAYKKMFRTKMERREDKSINTSLNLSYDFKDQSINTNLSLSHLKNESNLNRYNYDRDKFVFSILKYF